MGDPGTIATVATAAVVVGGVLWAVWLKWLRGPWRGIVVFFTRLGQTVNGRPAEVDAYGREQAPAIPPLAEQMVSIHATVAGLSQTVDILSKRDERTSALELSVANLDKRVTAIEAGHQLERSLGHVAAAKTFDAIEAVARKGEHEPVDEPDTEL